MSASAVVFQLNLDTHHDSNLAYSQSEMPSIKVQPVENIWFPQADFSNIGNVTRTQMDASLTTHSHL